MTTQTLTNTTSAVNIRQFLKFGLVGVSNNVVDYVAWRIMMGHFGWGWLPAQLVAFTMSVTNGFVWNSMWTYRGIGSGARHARYCKFFVVNIASMVFGLILMKATLTILDGQINHVGTETLSHLNIAKAIAIGCGLIWNYTLNTKWTFK